MSVYVAVGAVLIAAVAVLIAIAAYSKLATILRAQELLLGGEGKTDMVDFAVSLQGRVDDLHRAVDELAAALSRVDRRIDSSLSRTALIRYDAYEDTGGHQSASLAMLDSERSGVVVTAIQGRDYARVYVKQLDRGRTPIALSPEEQQAVERAMSGAEIEAPSYP
jgi:outer membrane receptor for ferrienterochelin and colicin